MCGRYGLVSPKKLKERFEVDNDFDELSPRYNIAPSQNSPVITKHSPNQLQIMRWGLIPIWAKDAKIGYSMINARAESVAEKPSYKNLLKSHRCLIPASNFYEWKKTPEGKDPYCIKLKGEDIFAFAGLYSEWTDKETGKQILTYTIITCEPNSLMKDIHDRMPVILDKDGEEAWLNPDTVEVEHLLPLLIPFDADKMEAYKISSLINKPQNDLKEILKPIE